MSQDSYNILTDQTENFSLEQKLAYIKHQQQALKAKIDTNQY